jgi:hypothetical protein
LRFCVFAFLRFCVFAFLRACVPGTGWSPRRTRGARTALGRSGSRPPACRAAAVVVVVVATTVPVPADPTPPREGTQERERERTDAIIINRSIDIHSATAASPIARKSVNRCRPTGQLVRCHQRWLTTVSSSQQHRHHHHQQQHGSRASECIENEACRIYMMARAPAAAAARTHVAVRHEVVVLALPLSQVLQLLQIKRRELAHGGLKVGT